MKRLFSLLLTLLLLGCLTLTASADVLWEPDEDPVYDYETAQTIARIYDVPADQTVNFYASPNDSQPAAVLQPGDRVYVGFSQIVGGELWGVGYPLDGSYQEGWFRLNRLQREYDNECFTRDFQDQLSTDTPVYDVADLTGDIPTWTYPGSGIADRTLYQDGLDENYNDGQLTFSYVYTDPDGGQWGYVGYYMGRCGWVYLTDLYAAETPLFPHQAESTVTETGPETDAASCDVSDSGISVSMVLILIGAVVVVTGALIAVLKVKHK